MNSISKKLHISDICWHYDNGKKVIDCYKTLCGKKADTIDDAQTNGFMAMVKLDNPSLCKSCQNILSTSRHWKQSRELSNIKKI